MKRILLSLFFITIVSVSTFSQQIANELLKKNSAFAVKLLAGTNGVIYRKGFGYYEKEHGYVLTTYNSIAGFDMVKFIDMNGDTLNGLGVAGLDQTADLVLIKVAEPKTEKANVDFNVKFKLNERIYVIGVDAVKMDTVYSGIITDAFVNNDGLTLFNSTVTTRPGIEGGLVFNEQMKLVGITKGLYRNNYYSTYVISLQYAKNMLEISKRKILPFTDSLLYSAFNVAYWRGIYAAEKGVGDYEEAIYHFKTALKEKPKDLNTYFQLGLTFGLKNQLDSSVFYYKEAIKIDSRFTFGYINLSVAYIMKNDYASAVMTLKDAVKLNSQYPKIHFYLGYALLKNNQPTEAIKSLKKSLELQPNDSEVLEELSEAYYLNKKYRDAVKAANQALKLNPNASNALYVLGVTNIELGNREEAEKIYQSLDRMDKMKANSLLEKLNGK